MSKYLFNKKPIVIDTDIAIALGLKEAIIIQQVHYWLVTNEEVERNFHEGRYWTYNTLNQWHKKYFPFWSLMTVRRTIKRLEELEILLVGSFNKNPSNRTKWYSINYKMLDLIIEEFKVKQECKNKNRNKTDPYVQNEQMPICSKRTNAYVQNEQIYNTENNNTEINLIYPSGKTNSREEVDDYVKKKIGYDGLKKELSDNNPWLSDIVSLMTEVFLQVDGDVRISGRNLEVSRVKEQFNKINKDHLIYLVESLERSKPNMKNIKSYLLTSIYNAPNTVKSFNQVEKYKQQKRSGIEKNYTK